MPIEDKIFQNTELIIDRLKSYGFKEHDKFFVLCKNFLHNKFMTKIFVDKLGNVNGKIFDLETNEEYQNFRNEMYQGSFVGSIRDEYTKILIDIKNNCFVTKFFTFPQTERVVNYIKNKYNVTPEFLWKKYPKFGVFRNSNIKKWFGIVMNIDKSNLTKESGQVEVINLKSLDVSNLIKQKNFYPAYHMNKKNWISIILDDSLKDEVIFNQIDISFNLVKNRV